MCASYVIKPSAEEIDLMAELRIDISDYYNKIIVPHRPAPVIYNELKHPVLTAMQFALLPSWAKEPKVKFATHNARLESVVEKPTWRTIFVKRHCLVPMTDFFEPIYSGEYAGNMVDFGESNNEMLYAAGVWDEWLNKETGEIIHSFSILTHEPPPFVARIGHDRCPLFLTREDGEEWLENEGTKPNVLKSFLIENKYVPDFTVSKQRAMRPGWEKRA